MGLKRLFGKKPEKKEEAADFTSYGGMAVGVTDAEDGRPLFQAELQEICGDTALLKTLRMDAEELPPAPTDVLLRGYSKKESKAVLLEAKITPDEEPNWRAEGLILRKSGNDRSHFRLWANLEAGTASPSVPGNVTPCRLLDISAGGARFSSQKRFHIGEQLILTVRLLSEREPLRLYCRVLRIVHRENGREEYGCQFQNVSPADQEVVTQMIFELQRRRKNSD